MRHLIEAAAMRIEAGFFSFTLVRFFAGFGFRAQSRAVRA